MVELFVLGVDGEDGACFDRVGLFEDGVSVVVEDGLAICALLLDPVFEVDTDPAGYADGGEEDGGDAVGAGDDGENIDEGDVGASWFSGPEGDIVNAGHA